MRNNRRPTFYCLRTQKQNPKTNNQKKLTTYQHYHFIKKGHFNIRKVEIQERMVVLIGKPWKRREMANGVKC